MKSPLQRWTVILVLSCASGVIMALALYIAARVAGFVVQGSVALIIGIVTAGIMVFEVRRLLQ
jgi:hypothetical protein